MDANEIEVGGIYIVRFTKDIEAEARIAKELNRNGPKSQHWYMARLTEPVGTYDVGHVFKVCSRSVYDLVIPPEEGAALRPQEEEEWAPSDAQRAPVRPSTLAAATRGVRLEHDEEGDSDDMLLDVKMTLTVPASELTMWRVASRTRIHSVELAEEENHD